MMIAWRNITNRIHPECPTHLREKSMGILTISGWLQLSLFIDMLTSEGVQRKRKIQNISGWNLWMDTMLFDKEHDDAQFFLLPTEVIS